jgi:hypothetical protein
MSLYCDTGVSVENWIEMKPNVTMKYEVDRLNNVATLFFGGNGTFVLNIGHENLAQMVELSTKALDDLKAADLPLSED